MECKFCLVPAGSRFHIPGCPEDFVLTAEQKAVMLKRWQQSYLTGLLNKEPERGNCPVGWRLGAFDFDQLTEKGIHTKRQLW